MTELLRAKQVNDEYGISRSSLLRYEEQGAIRPQYTPGGQRRYTRESLEGLMIEGEVNEGVDVKPSNSNERWFNEFGTMLPNKWNLGEDEIEPLRELRGRSGRKLLREMRMNDPVISAIFFAIENAMKQASWQVVPSTDRPEDKEVADFVESCMEDMSFTWKNTMSFVLQMLEQGFSILEVIFKRRLGENPPMYIESPASSQFDDGRIGWRKWSPRPANSLVPNDEWVRDKNGGIQGIKQEVDDEIVPIHISKLLLFRTTVVPNNNPEGMPIHRAMYIPWWYSQNIAEIEGIGIERNLSGLPVVYLGKDCTLSGPNSDYQRALDLVTNIRVDEQAGVVLPKPKLTSGTDGNGILLELLSPLGGGQKQFDTDKIIERYDKRKALSTLAQFIMLGMEKVGSFALSKHQGDLFTIALGAYLDDIADVINRYAIPKLVRMNMFPGRDGYPKLRPNKIGVPDLEGIANFVNQLVEKDVITPDIELERVLRQRADLPDVQMSEDESGNLVPNRQDIPLEKAALLVRRVGLAIRSLEDTGAIPAGAGAPIIQPLIEELQAGIENEVVKGKSFGSRTKVSPETEIETVDVTGKTAEQEEREEEEEE